MPDNQPDLSREHGAAGIIADVAFELMRAVALGLKWEAVTRITQDDDGAYNDGREIVIKIKPKGEP